MKLIISIETITITTLLIIEAGFMLFTATHPGPGNGIPQTNTYSICWMTGMVLLVFLAIAILIAIVALIICLIDGDIKLFKPIEIKLWLSKKEKDEINSLLQSYGNACVEKNEYQEERLHRQLENLGYFK